MSNHRSGQDELFDALRQNEEQLKRGKLKIYFGISPGVGKTYSMLEAAQAEAAKGIRVVVGCVACRNITPIDVLLEGLAVVAPKITEYKDLSFEEMDLDAIIKMKPQLVLVSDLSRRNTPVSHNLNRYQDIQELLDTGIDVYTTLSMIYLESCISVVSQITGLHVTQSLPDVVFEQADDVEFVDIAPDIYISRVAGGEVFLNEDSRESLKNFFHKEVFLALRTILLHKISERTSKHKRRILITGNMFRYLTLIDAETDSMHLIRRTKAIADITGATWTALYVENNHTLNEIEKKQLTDNFDLVRQLKGDLITFSGNDLVKSVFETAHRENITHIVVGNYKRRWMSGLFKKNLAIRLMEKKEKYNLFVVNLNVPEDQKSSKILDFYLTAFKIWRLMIVVLLSLVSASYSTVLANKTGNSFLPITTIFAMFVMTVFFRANILLLLSTLALLTLSVFLLPPWFTFQISFPADIDIFLTFFVVAFVNGILSTWFRTQEMHAHIREKQTAALFHLNKRLGTASSIREVVDAGMVNIRIFFSFDAYFIFGDNNFHLTNLKYIPQGIELSEYEMNAASWAYKHDRIAGRFTDIEPSCKYTFYPMKSPSIHLGVVMLNLNKELSGRDSVFWDAFLAQITQALEHQHLEYLASKTALLNESDKLYKTLFNSISHELRIPVATIMGASDILLETNYPEQARTKLYGEILEASKRLNRLIENLLNMSRLESGRIAAHLDWCDIHDLFNNVTDSLADELQPFRLDMVIPESMPLVKLDFGLMEQVLYNLVYNSTIYAYPKTTIRMKAWTDNKTLVLQVMDRGGPGFEPQDLPFIFNKFWRYKKDKPGGLGLGLSIVKGFVEAHKGTVTVENRKNGGVRFTMTIPVETSNESIK